MGVPNPPLSQRLTPRACAGAARLQSADGAVRGSNVPNMSVSTLPSVDAHAPDLVTLQML